MQHPLIGETLFNARACTTVNIKSWRRTPGEFMRCKASWRSTLQLSHLAVEILTPVYLVSFDVRIFNLCKSQKCCVTRGAL